MSLFSSLPSVDVNMYSQQSVILICLVGDIGQFFQFAGDLGVWFRGKFYHKYFPAVFHITQRVKILHKPQQCIQSFLLRTVTFRDVALWIAGLSAVVKQTSFCMNLERYFQTHNRLAHNLIIAVVFVSERGPSCHQPWKDEPFAFLLYWHPWWIFFPFISPRKCVQCKEAKQAICVCIKFPFPLLNKFMFYVRS